MATYFYVDSATGNNSDSGLTWALAKSTIAGALTAITSGTLSEDRHVIFVASGHSESNALFTYNDQPNTTGAYGQIVIISADKTTGEPPTTYTRGATLTFTDACGILPGITLKGFNLTATNEIYFYPLNYEPHAANLEDCVLSASSYYFPSPTLMTDYYTNYLTGINFSRCDFKFNSSVGYVGFYTMGGSYTYVNCNFMPTGSVPSVSLFFSKGGNHRFDLCRFYTINTPLELMFIYDGTHEEVTHPSPSAEFAQPRFELNNCHIDPACLERGYILDHPTIGYWITQDTGIRYNQGEMIIARDCGTTSRPLQYYRRTSALTSVKLDLDTYRTGGASRGESIGYSLKHYRYTEYDSYPFYVWGAIHTRSDMLSYWNDDSSESLTLTVELLFDTNATVTDENTWMEVFYLGENASKNPTNLARGSFASTRKSPLPSVSATELTTGSGISSWTKGTATYSWVSKKLTITISPQEWGLIGVQICSYMTHSFWLDPYISVS